MRAAFATFGSRVRMLGCLQDEELHATYAAADVFVWPAIKEPIGMVFLEAQAAGLPVIGAKRPGVGEIVVHGVTGLLPPEGCSRSFAGAVSNLLADAPLRRKMGAAGLAHARANHDIDTAGRTFVDAIASTVAGTTATI